MGRLCVGQGGTLIPDAFLKEILPDAYLDWSKDYPGSQTPPAPPPPPPGDAPSLADVPDDSTNMDAWALTLLGHAWGLLTGSAPHSRGLLALAALSRSETFYGWPRFPQGADARSEVAQWWGHHNWVGLRCTTLIGGRPVPCYQNQGCVAGFMGNAKVRSGSGWTLVPTCFEHQATNLQGALSFVKAALAPGYQAMQALERGDTFELAHLWLASGMLVRSVEPDQAQLDRDGAHYAGRMLAAARAITQNVDIPMDLTNSAPPELGTSPLDPGEPPGPADLPAPKRGVSGRVGTALSIGFGIVVGAVGIWATRTSRA